MVLAIKKIIVHTTIIAHCCKSGYKIWQEVIFKFFKMISFLSISFGGKKREILTKYEFHLNRFLKDSHNNVKNYEKKFSQ